MLFRATITMLPSLVGFSLPRLMSEERVKSSLKATPPSFVFPIVWGSVYLLFGSLLYALVTQQRWVALALACAHLAFSFAWTPTFTSGDRRAALYIILAMLALLFALVATLLQTVQPLPVHTALLAAYAAWLIFALQLNLYELERQVETAH
jgi:tryptophan-rich sensory protein